MGGGGGEEAGFQPPPPGCCCVFVSIYAFCVVVVYLFLNCCCVKLLLSSARSADVQDMSTEAISATVYCCWSAIRLFAGATRMPRPSSSVWHAFLATEMTAPWKNSLPSIAAWEGNRKVNNTVRICHTGTKTPATS